MQQLLTKVSNFHEIAPNFTYMPYSQNIIFLSTIAKDRPSASTL